VAQACKVSAMPTFQAYFNGELVDTLVGADPRKLQDMIKE
jgi:thioredoxin-like negative regulator of GroEL